MTDQHTTYGTKVIVATRREAHYVLDEILGNATDIPVTEHTTGTHGVTLVNFALFDLLGLQLSPRIRDLGEITLYRTGPESQASAAFPLAGPLLTRRANTELIAAHWDDLLRLAGSLKFGHATASLLVGKLSASGRQNALAAALKEYGTLRRTVYAARYPADDAGAVAAAQQALLRAPVEEADQVVVAVGGVRPGGLVASAIRTKKYDTRCQVLGRAWFHRSALMAGVDRAPR